MILVRVVFHAHHGKITQLVEGMTRVTQNVPDRPRILTDLSGPTDTMVVESRHASLAAYEQWRAELFASPVFQENEAREGHLVASGSVEFYTIEQE